jgi:aldehyde dehydrogenase (NAD+)
LVVVEGGSCIRDGFDREDDADSSSGQDTRHMPETIGGIHRALRRDRDAPEQCGETDILPSMPDATWSTWRGTSLRRRIAWLRQFRRLVAAEQQSLCRLMQLDVGKPVLEGLTADVMPLLACCRWHERHAAALLRSRRVRGGAWWQLGQHHRVFREPLGRVGVIATWNYPLQLLGAQLVPALVAGNDVIVKPSEHAGRSQVRLLELAVSAGLPQGTLRWVEATREAGPRLLREHRLDHLVFTGSTAVGRSIAEWAADRLVPTTLELSGRDSAIVLDDADPELAASRIWQAVTMNAGQTCMAPRRALVDRRVYRAFVAALAPLASGARARPLIGERAAREAFDLARDAVERGGRTLSSVLEPPDGAALVPVAIVDCPEDAPLVDGGHFGPVLAVVPVHDEEHALAVHDRCDQHLASSVFTAAPRRAESLARRLGACSVTINDVVLPIAHPATSVGGRGASGWGLTQGREGLLAMTRPVFVARSSRWLRPGTDPPSPDAVERLASIVRRLYGGGRTAADARPDRIEGEAPASGRASDRARTSVGSATDE